MLTMVFLHPDRSSPCPLKIPSFSATDVHLGAGGDAVALVHALQRHAVQGERSWGSSRWLQQAGRIARDINYINGLF